MVTLRLKLSWWRNLIKRYQLVVFGLILMIVLGLTSFLNQTAQVVETEPDSLSPQKTISDSSPVIEVVVTKKPAPLGIPNTLTISSLAISAPIIYPASSEEKVFQSALNQGVVHYPGSAAVGDYGNVYIFGHSSDYSWSRGKYKTIFSSLPNIKLGEIIVITNLTGQEFSYTVTKKFVTAVTDMEVLSQGEGNKKMLTLQTSYPIGTAKQRYIVQAELLLQP
jgi:LPXTG-site transpeptidase (sortase) family protein